MPGYIVCREITVKTTQYIEAATEEEARALAKYVGMPISGPHAELTPWRTTVLPAPDGIGGKKNDAGAKCQGPLQS